ncbi:MAG: hypothetical protein A2580_09135 [Hydrogenophilales bacterium RIFOXYD1_FULL_62_11]|nr:MAG: hypothetical protein A2580_09135 [Hydrogenophilales bacterium RIFOXYD1_FULL_62_11]
MRTFDCSRIDTTPGGQCVFSPPAAFAGGEDAYAKWLKDEYERDPLTKQCMVVLMRYQGGTLRPFRPTIIGPFAGRLQKACERLQAHLKATAGRHPDG